MYSTLILLYGFIALQQVLQICWTNSDDSTYPTLMYILFDTVK